MRYCILGPTRAHGDDGAPVPVGGARLRALLAALALRPGRALTTETLIDEVWDGDPPTDAAGALQALVARLRRALGHAAVGSAEGGYRLNACADDVDLHRFERLSGEGRRALEGGDPHKAATLLREALDLWGGEPLADLAARTAYAARYDALHADAVRLRLAADLELGHAERVVPEFAALCAEHPLNEQLHVLHIRALRDAGRPADALAAYEAARTVIADRLGTDPGPQLRALHGELLRTAPEPVARPPRTTGNLKARLTSFVGREADLGGLGEDLATARLVTLTGPGGSGKTRLSLEAAERYGAGWSDGVWLAELAPVGDARTVPEAVLNALGLRETVIRSGTADKALAPEARQQDPARMLTDFCESRRLLLVLDNCEHVIDACAELAEQLLVRCPGVTVLATSREPLGVPGELVRPVDPLPEPTALRLLADRAVAARPGFDPADDPAACAEICRRLDGLPLAIELAAARLRSMAPRQVAERLDDRFRLLTGGSRTVLPRQQTLRAVVDWSWELLEPLERALLRRMAVFSGGCDLAAAEAVCGGDELDSRDVAPLLGSLVDKSLVLADLAADRDDARYRMLETIGEYAAERLAEAGEREAVERSHIAYFREYARTADPELRGPRQVRWLDRFEREHDNLRAALRRAVDSGAEPEALQLVLACSWFWQMRNYRTELASWPRSVAALGPDPFEAPGAPVVPLERTPLDQPLPLPPEQLDEARRWVRMLELMAPELGLGMTRQVSRGRAIIDAYAPHLPQSSLRPGLLRPLAVFFTGDFSEIQVMLEELVASCRAHGRLWELACALQLRAKALNDISGRLHQAVDDARESRDLFARVADRWGTVEALGAEAETAGFRGEWARAGDCCRQAIAIARELGAHQQIPQFTVQLGEAVANCGDLAEGERLLRAGIAEGVRLAPGADVAVYYGRAALAGRLGRRGEFTEALAQVDSLTDGTYQGVPEFVRGMLHGLRGWLVARSGEPLEGRRQMGVAFDELHRHQAGDTFFPRLGLLLLPLAVTVLALVCEHADEDGSEPARQAAVLVGAHETLRPVGVSPAEREELVETAGRLRAALGEQAYQAAHAEGARLSADAAVDFARSACR